MSEVVAQNGLLLPLTVETVVDLPHVDLVGKWMKSPGNFIGDDFQTAIAPGQIQRWSVYLDGVGDGSKVEFVAGAERAAQPEPVEPQNAFEVGEQHLDLFSLVARGLVGIALGDLASDVARVFVDRAQHFAGRSVGAAARLQRAWPAVVHAGPVAEQIVFRHTGPRRGEPPAIVLEDLAGRAAVGVTGVVVGEVLARESAVGETCRTPGCALDPALMDQPVQHLGRAVAGVRNQSLRPQVEAIVSATPERFVADSPLEEGGFEPSVPLAINAVGGTSAAEVPSRVTRIRGSALALFDHFGRDQARAGETGHKSCGRAGCR
jgi:hypothetical protein